MRVDVIGRDTDLTFDEIEEHLFPVPAVVLDASDSEEAGGPVHEVATSSELPYINKIVGPSPQRAEPEGGGAWHWNLADGRKIHSPVATNMERHLHARRSSI